MHVFTQEFVNGLVLGSQYALWTLGYGLVFQVLGLMHFAHGDTLLVGIYIAFAFTVTVMFPVALAITIVIIVTALLEVVVWKTIYAPQVRRRNPTSAFISALAAAYVIRSIVIIHWGQATYNFPALFPNRIIRMGGYLFASNDFVVLGIALVVIGSFRLFLEKTRTGQGIVYISQDRDTASLMGIHVSRVTSLVYALSGVVGIIGGLLYASTYGLVSPETGFTMTLKAFIAALIGGIGRLEGAVLGGLVLGLIETYASTYVSSLYSDAIVFACVIVILLLKPSGLVGRENLLRP